MTATHDTQTAFRFLKNAITANGKPSLVNIDQSEANTAGLNQVNREQRTCIKIRQCKYSNNIIEQDHRRIKRLTQQMLGFKNVYAAQRILTGIEVVSMIKKGQIKTRAGNTRLFADQF